jgi:hypothetical protein
MLKIFIILILILIYYLIKKKEFFSEKIEFIIPEGHRVSNSTVSTFSDLHKSFAKLIVDSEYDNDIELIK